MEKNKNYLQFDDATIRYQLENGIYWIVASDICDVLEVDWKNQHRKIRNDSILKGAVETKPIFREDGQSRSMVCIQEKFVYGWIFQIESQNEVLQNYKWKVYHILFDFFKGVITRRHSILEERKADKEELKRLESSISESEDGKRIKDLKKKIRSSSQKLGQLDRDMLSRQGKLFD